MHDRVAGTSGGAWLPSGAPVGEAHNDGNVNIHEQRALPRGEVARHCIISPLKEWSPHPRELAPRMLVVDGLTAAMLLTARQREGAARALGAQQPRSKHSASVHPHEAQPTLEEPFVDRVANEHPLHHDHALDTIRVYTDYLMERGQHVIHWANVPI